MGQLRSYPAVKPEIREFTMVEHVFVGAKARGKEQQIPLKDAIDAITIHAVRFLNLADRVGSIARQACGNGDAGL
ncbi:hypothetical protein Tamer19_38250 [Cupriavidus sp. TA19]|uniref:amidohydrolase family protein n=1 Tax=unclassified Cupriavidus TaxID=2640874 RepID=UPI000E2E5E4E|nr:MULTISPECIES: amidohydrolase family protein [unclassified Cupriavidus]BDB29722.1 amidohydrolase family protein [Cupriavidus sp. P-10]GLC94417.1 hypothetical protein Tamer19_38250 [Cupriavidus sp. TA19]